MLAVILCNLLDLREQDCRDRRPEAELETASTRVPVCTGDMRGWGFAPNLAEILPRIVQIRRHLGPANIGPEILHIGQDCGWPESSGINGE